MTRRNTPRIAFIGFGEAGQAMASGLGSMLPVSVTAPHWGVSVLSGPFWVEYGSEARLSLGRRAP